MKISKKEREEIERIIKAAEMKTSGEIIPAIFHSSSSYSIAHFKMALFMALFGPLLITYLESLNLFQQQHEFNILFVLFISIVVGFLISYIPAIKKLMLNHQDFEEATHSKALEIFWKNNLSLTRNRTGILIFISLFEKRVVVLADAGINLKVPENFWDDVVKTITISIREENIVKGLEKAILMCGDKLSQNFPHKQDDINELANEILTDFDPSKLN